ncbi:MAG: hypothetical protein B7Z55_08115 [Planctomycetales bacterium 12-60-4]|nr:MAG: hypothetical protein B7Z55_08115 [Planctomycetales bacterium 12-60-4]
MSEVAKGRSDGTGALAASAVRPAWLKPRDSVAMESVPAAKRRQPPPLPKPAEPSGPAVEVERPQFVRPTTLGGWLVLLWQLFLQWWTGLYLGWGVTVSLLLHATVAVALGLTYYSLKSDNGLMLAGAFDEVQEGEDLELPVDTKLDTSFGDKAATLEFTAASVTGDLDTLQSAESLLAGTMGDGDDAGDGDVAMARNIRVPESAITRGSFTVWTEPEDPAPRVAYDIVIQVKLPPSVKQYRLSDLSGSVTGTDGYRKQIKYTSKDRKGVKEGIVQLTIKIPGAAQLVKDVIEIKSKILDEEQTIEIVF